MGDEVLQIALLDDDTAFLAEMRGYLEQAAREQGLAVHIETHASAIDFASDYHCESDIIFIDVEMPGIDGFDVTRRIRERDKTVCFIFVTNLAQYAIRGYKVNALEYLIKPVSAYIVADKLSKAAAYCAQRRERMLLLGRGEEAVRIPYSDILSIEKDGNYLVYHTVQGAFRKRGTMTDSKEDFLSDGFGKCSSGCIVNYAHVSQVLRDSVCVDGRMLPVSRSHYKSFLNGFMDYYGGKMG